VEQCWFGPTCEVSPIELTPKVKLPQVGQDTRLLGHRAINEATGDVEVCAEAVPGVITTLTPTCSQAQTRQLTKYVTVSGIVLILLYNQVTDLSVLANLSSSTLVRIHWASPTAD
jgi:hypothetical protein